MAGSHTEGVLTLKAGEALGANVRVKVESGTATDPVEVVAAGAGEQHIGTTEYAAADGEFVAVRPRNMDGTHMVTAAGAFSRGATLYGAASGKVDDASSGSAIGVAMEAATADGDIVEMIDFSVLSTTAGTVSIDDAGGHTSETTVEAALQEIYQDLLSAQAFIPVPVTGLIETDGTNTVAFLGPSTTPKLDLANGDTDSGLLVTWAGGNSDAVAFQVPLPPDLDASADIVLHLRAAMSNTNDTPVINADTYFDEGDTKVEDASGAVTGTSYAEYTITVAAADVPSGAQTMTVELTPATHGTDDLKLSALWVEHTRALRAS